MVAHVLSGALLGVDAFLVRVEVDLARGLPTIAVVGLAESAVREGRDRIMAAFAHAGIQLPTRRITISLSPADVSKSGSAFDLPIALGLLAGAGVLRPQSLDGVCAVGELGLDGEVRPVRGALSIADMCRDAGVRTLFAPAANAAEAAAVQGIDVYATSSLQALIAHLSGREQLPLADESSMARAPMRGSAGSDYADVRGQQLAKRAMEVAAAGQHNVLLVGPPGSGKSMIARRLPGILPAMTLTESIEVTKIYSVAGRLRANESLVRTRPFRAPHHTTSDAAMIGGGPASRPGEVTLAHRGVLFMDELPEFKRNVLESLRQPLEDASVTVSRARAVVTYPARFMLVAAMNPCPCGYHGTGTIPCICTQIQVRRYAARISGPLLDRIDLHVRVPPLAASEISSAVQGESSEAIRSRVDGARERQLRRYRDEPAVLSNAELGVREVRRYCTIDADGENIIRRAVKVLGLSARAYHRVLRLARTMADLDSSDTVRHAHVAEAILYRTLDRNSTSGTPLHV